MLTTYKSDRCLNPEKSLIRALRKCFMPVAYIQNFFRKEPPNFDIFSKRIVSGQNYLEQVEEQKKI